jgi:TatD DNase family protein
MVDIGVNLCGKQFKGYHTQLIDYAYQEGLHGIISISNSVRESFENVELLKTLKTDPNNKLKLWSTIGIHPHDAKSVKETDWSELEKLFLNDFVVAVGECGLDYNRDFSPRSVQRDVFLRQLELSKKLNKPIYLHDRDATDDMVLILTKFMKDNEMDKLNGVIHCFTGNYETMKKYLDMGLYIGITGWICNTRRNKDLVDAVKKLPLDRLLIETDAPWLIPPEFAKKWNTKRNEPSALNVVAEHIAFHLKIKVDEVFNHSIANTKSLFKVDF